MRELQIGQERIQRQILERSSRAGVGRTDQQSARHLPGRRTEAQRRLPAEAA